MSSAPLGSVAIAAALAALVTMRDAGSVSLGGFFWGAGSGGFLRGADAELAGSLSPEVGGVAGGRSEPAGAGAAGITLAGAACGLEVPDIALVPRHDI